MAEEVGFKYDPEAEENSKKYRLPFALCKKYGIQIEDWWQPRDAWNALKKNGNVDRVSDEYKDYYRKLKKQYSKESRERAKNKRAQLKDDNHIPNRKYKHQDGMIDGAIKGAPMTFAQADNGNCNPYYGKGLIGYKTNCQTCVATYVARRQGYNVRALPNLNNKNIWRLSRNTSLAYIGAIKQDKPFGVRTDLWLEQTVKQGEIYSVEFRWGKTSHGHIITCERGNDGVLRLYDPQIDEITSNKDIRNYFSRTSNVKVMNLTNAKIDEKFCDMIMKKGV